VDGEFYAIEDVCTHDGGPLDQGELEGEEIECPRHGGRFDVRSGRATMMPAVMPVQTYAVRIDGDDLFVSSTPLAEG
jgi:3-phenylpropionate/trans-cinnamate dioxygenase ferredoxin subunit